MTLQYLLDFLTCKTCEGNTNFLYVWFQADKLTATDVLLSVFQVKNIGFTGVFRLIFKPLVDEFPCFGAVSVSLREKVGAL